MVGLKNLEAELATTLYKINSQTFPRKFSEIFQDSYFEKKNKTKQNNTKHYLWTTLFFYKRKACKHIKAKIHFRNKHI